jgi:predicted membrane protein DUF2157
MLIGLIFVVAILLGGGLIAFIASNWEVIPRPVRVAGLVALDLILVAACAVTALRKPAGSWPIELLGALSVIAAGGSISLVGQMYHFPANWPAFGLSMMIIALATAVVAGSSASIWLAAAAQGWYLTSGLSELVLTGGENPLLWTSDDMGFVVKRAGTAPTFAWSDRFAIAAPSARAGASPAHGSADPAASSPASCTGHRRWPASVPAASPPTRSKCPIVAWREYRSVADGSGSACARFLRGRIQCWSSHTFTNGTIEGFEKIHRMLRDKAATDRSHEHYLFKGFDWVKQYIDASGHQSYQSLRSGGTCSNLPRA